MALSRWGDGGADKQPYNIILAGAFGVGKSSLFRQLSTEVDGDYLYTTLPATVNLKQQTRPAATATTVPSSSRYLDKWTHSALVLGDTVQVTLWDTGNLERAGIRNVTRSYFRYAVGVILVYDVSCRESFDALYDWMYYIKDSVSQHLPKRPITFVVWGNNKDQCSDCVSVDHIKSFLESQGLNQEDCYNVNTCTGLHVFESYHDLLERVHRAFRQQSWDKHRTVSQTYTDNKSICSC